MTKIKICKDPKVGLYVILYLGSYVSQIKFCLGLNKINTQYYSYNNRIHGEGQFFDA
jgi:hypothetical protein